MSADQIQSFAKGPEGAIISALAGTLIAYWLKKKWSRWVPVKFGTKGRADLLKEHKTTLQITKALSVAGIFIGLLCYGKGRLNHHDWRGLGLGLGLVAFLPLCYMVAVNMKQGTEAIKECMITYVIAQKAPTGLMIAIMTLFLVASLVSAISLLL